MRTAPSSLVAVSLTLLAASAGAAESPDAPVVLVGPLPRPPSAAEAPPDFAPARTGFQLGVRFSVQVPAGGLGGGSSFSDMLGLVHTGAAASLSGFVQHAIGIALDDVAGWRAMLGRALEETGGPLTQRERRRADAILGGRPVGRRRRRAA